MAQTQDRIWDVLCEMSGEEVARAFTNYYGMCKLNDEFAEFLCDEGYCDNLIDDDDDDDETDSE